MLEFCVKQNVFLYAMIAAGIAGVWCLFWNNRFYTRAIRDLGRLKEPKSKWTRSVLETCQRKAHPFSNAGAFMRSQIAQGRSAGIITENEAKIGYVAAYPNAEVISGYTAFLLFAPC